MSSYGWAILTMLLWGCVPIIEKLGLGHISVWVGLFFRTCGVMVGFIMLTIFKFDSIKTAVIDLPKGWLFLALGGFLAAMVGNFFYYNALKHGEVSKIIPIIGSFPIVSFILGVLLFNEQITVNRLAGLMCIVIGVFLLKL